MDSDLIKFSAITWHSIVWKPLRRPETRVQEVNSAMEKDILQLQE